MFLGGLLELEKFSTFIEKLLVKFQNLTNFENRDFPEICSATLKFSIDEGLDANYVLGVRAEPGPTIRRINYLFQQEIVKFL